MAYYKDRFIHSVPEEVIADIGIILSFVATHSEHEVGAAQRLEKYVEDYKKNNEI